MQEEAESSTSMMEQERDSTAAAARAWQNELEGLLRLSNQREAWPAPVRRLVEERERVAAEAAKRELRKEVEDMEKALEDDTRSYQEKMAAVAAMQEAAAAAKASAKARVDSLEAELAAREEAAERQLEEQRAAAEQQVASLRQELEDTRTILVNLEQEAAEEREKSEAWASGMQAELLRVRDRARDLMAQRDAEVAALKAKLRSSGLGISPLTLEKPEASDLSTDDSDLMPGDPIMPQASLSGMSASSAEAARDGEGNPKAACAKKSIGAVVEKLADLLRHAKEKPGEQIASALLIELASSAEAAAAAAAAQEARVAEAVAALEDSERTHSLRDQTTQVLKDEINKLQRNMQASSVDTVYLKNILVSGFEKGELSASSSVLTVIGRLLCFSPDELERSTRGSKALQRKKSSSSSSGHGFSLAGFSIPSRS